MTRLRPWRAALLSGLWLLAGAGCGSSTSTLDLTSSDPAQDQWKIAAHYSREAASLRRKSEEQANRAMIYERLFGPDSEWVRGARLLADFYEDQARELEQRAGDHLDLARQRPRAQASPAGPR